ncbi:MAG: NAD(P)-dependent oxidoreductase [Halobacteria archaeon]
MANRASRPLYPRHYPLLVRLSRVVVFGGGQAGTRKTDALSRVAPVTVVSREFSPRLKRMSRSRSGRIRLVRAVLEPRRPAVAAHLRGATLAVAATDDPLLNRFIEERCRARGVLVNRADRAGGVILPSVVRTRGFIVAVASGSPATTRRVRKVLEARIGRGLRTG